MSPTEFPQQNNVIAKPESMTDEQCTGLPAYHYKDENQYPNVLSCWQFTDEEWEEMSKTRKVWVNTMGVTVTPFALMGCSPFANVVIPENN